MRSQIKANKPKLCFFRSNLENVCQRYEKKERKNMFHTQTKVFENKVIVVFFIPII